jgi:hypothetical protein
MTTPVDQTAALNVQLKLYDSQLAVLNNQLKNKNMNANSKIILQRQIEDITGKRTSTQNQVYEKSGQYDKLLTGASRDAYMALNSLFSQYGLGTLAGKIFDFVKNGYSSDTISVLLQDTTEYKQRFAANTARQKAGLPVLSPAEYLSTESSYRQIMRQSGLPMGFYDTPADFTAWISGDVSPTEVQKRVDLATQATILANPMYKQALNAMGLSDSEMTAYFLDKDKSLPIIQKAAATAAIGGEALRQGLKFDQNYSDTLATQGVTRDQAAAGYSQIGKEYGSLIGLSGIYGGQWSQRAAEQAQFEGLNTAAEQKRRLISSEQGAFSGSAGAAKNGLAQSGGAR